MGGYNCSKKNERYSIMVKTNLPSHLDNWSFTTDKKSKSIKKFDVFLMLITFFTIVYFLLF